MTRVAQAIRPQSRIRGDTGLGQTRPVLDPGARIGDGDGDQETECHLAGQSVQDGKGLGDDVVVAPDVLLVEYDPGSAEQTLQDNQEQGAPAQPSEPDPGFAPGHPHGQDDAQEARSGGQESVAVFRHLVRFSQPPVRIDGSVGEGPVEKSHARTDGGGESTGIEQDGRPAQNQQTEPGQGGLIGRGSCGGGRCGHGFEVVT